MWEIDRFELAYFDGLHNHWQMFGECPEISSEQRKGSYSYHRTLVQELLDEIRKLFTTTLNNPGANAFTIKGKSSSNTKATIILDKKEVSKLNSTIVTFSDTILKHLEEEGLSDASVGEIRGFFKGLKTHISQGSGNAFKHVFSKVNYIYDLISLLPIEKDWDTMGIPYTSSPVYDTECMCWEEVVFFLLNYKNGSEETTSKKLLGYNVELEICVEAGGCTKGDFFDFCCNDDIVDTKVEQYKTYATIVDSLQKAIYGNDKTFKIYIIAYPIFIFNSLHYLYIYVKSKNDNGCIKKLKEDWLKVHEALNWSPQKTIITYLEQISSFTFQDRILYRIHNPHTYQINILDDKSIEDVFKETIACIFPTSGSLCAIEVSPGIEMSYSKPPWWKDKDPFGYQIMLVGRHQWKWLKFIADALGENIKHGSIAAMTAIIARNLSHNIGSHVLSRWIAALNELLIKGDEFKDLTNNKWTGVVANLGLGTALSRVSEYYKKLESSKPLFQYIQHRMDFIATVATSVPSSEMTMDFEKDITTPFKQQKVLLENIAASEGFDDLTKCFDVKVPGNCGRVSIPNGIVGTHAIYSILENFIRNAAKHCNSHLFNDFDIPDWSAMVKRFNDKNGLSPIEQYIYNKMSDCLKNKISSHGFGDFEKKSEFIQHLNSIIKDTGFAKNIKLSGVELDEWAESIKQKISNGIANIPKKEILRLNRHIIDKVLGKLIKDALRFKIELKIPDTVKLKGKPGNGLNNKVEFQDNVLTIKKDENDEIYMLTKGEQEQIKERFSNEEDKQVLERFFYIHERYIKLRIWDMREGSCDHEILEKLEAFSDTKNEKGRLIKEKGTINPGGWGIKEMIVSSNFLRKNSPEKLIGNIDKNEPSIMEIICGDDSDKIACKNGIKTCHRSDSYKDMLGIRFYLRRPKDMYIIGDKENVEIPKGKFEIEYANTILKEGDSLTEDIPHRLLYLPENIKGRYEKEPMAPMRIRTYNAQENTNIVNDKVYLEKYESFVKEVLNNDKDLPKIFSGTERIQTLNLESDGLCVSFGTSIDALRNEDIIYLIRHPENQANITSEDFTHFRTNNQYFQPVSGAFPFSSKIDQLSGLAPERQCHFALEIIESAITSVLIIDERISDFAKKEKFLDLMKIHVVNVNKENVSKDSISEEFNKIIAKNNKFHFLIIHQGILDKIEKEAKGKSNSLMKELGEKCQWIVIDSGRGVPNEIKDYENARFIETSAVLSMLETYDKHALVQTLFSLRRPFIEKEK